eukprot:583084-Rhodomonas_salina.4
MRLLVCVWSGRGADQVQGSDRQGTQADLRSGSESYLDLSVICCRHPSIYNHKHMFVYRLAHVYVCSCVCACVCVCVCVCRRLSVSVRPSVCPCPCPYPSLLPRHCIHLFSASHLKQIRAILVLTTRAAVVRLPVIRLSFRAVPSYMLRRRVGTRRPGGDSGVCRGWRGERWWRYAYARRG